MNERIAWRFAIRGVVQGVGFRPFVYRLATRLGVRGWVLNGDSGVVIHAEAPAAALAALAAALRDEPPPAARIDELRHEPAALEGHEAFAIRESARADRPTVRVSPDLPVCAACLAEMADPADRRHGYPYINCTDCGPRYSIVLGLPYDRPLTTMKDWPLCADCAREYHDPADRRFHAQPVACPACGPRVRLLDAARTVLAEDGAAVEAAAAALRDGRIVAIKGIGGYHLACDAGDAAALAALRERKYRKERPFAVLARDLATAEALAELSADARELLLGAAAPIVLAPARVALEGVAPGTSEIGVMLPYTPLQHLLFAAGAPARLVLTSANRSSEPIAYTDADALDQLGGIADLFLVGERPIARRVDDAVARAGPLGPMTLRRSRGYSPGAVGRNWPAGRNGASGRNGPAGQNGPAGRNWPGGRNAQNGRPWLALGADLKNAVALLLHGQATLSQHVGDLDHLAARAAFEAVCADLPAMYEIEPGELAVAHDLHPGYVSTAFAKELGRRHGVPLRPVQHHRAHVASVLAERGLFDETAIGLALDGTGYGDDGTIWGGEVFAGSVAGGLERVAHLRPAQLPGGDAAALFPPQAAAGFLAQLGELPDLSGPPFGFPERYAQAAALCRRGARLHTTTSAGRLFDAAAALCGYTREITYEGQAAIWLEQRAREAPPGPGYAFPWDGAELDWRPALSTAVEDRARGRSPRAIARAFHDGLAAALAGAAARLAGERGARVVVLSGGVLQNDLLLRAFLDALPARRGFDVLVNRDVPPNDGGIALGQLALAAFAPGP